MKVFLGEKYDNLFSVGCFWVGRFFVGRWRRFDFQKIMMHLDVRMFFLGVGAPDGGTPKRWIKISHSL